MKSGPRILMDNDAAPATSRTSPINPSVRVLLERRATMDGYGKPRTQSSHRACRLSNNQATPETWRMSGLLAQSLKREAYT
jgi:hypothetical protein